jgi:hypothetical protein
VLINVNVAVEKDIMALATLVGELVILHVADILEKTGVNAVVDTDINKYII